MLTVVIAVAVPKIPRESPEEKSTGHPKLENAKFSEQQLKKKAADLTVLITGNSKPVRVTMSPRPTRERNGHIANAVEVLCEDDRGHPVSFQCWDVVTGRLIIFSRAQTSNLTPNPAEQRSRVADTARNWLAITDLAPFPGDWRISSVRPQSKMRWIVKAAQSDRMAYVIVDRMSGVVVSMTTWQDWPTADHT